VHAGTGSVQTNEKHFVGIIATTGTELLTLTRSGRLHLLSRSVFAFEEGVLADVDYPARGGQLEFVAEICASALDPDRWEPVLRETSRLIEGSAAAIVAQTPNGNSRIEARWNVSAKLERALVAAAPFAPSVPAIWLLGIEKAFAISSLFCGERLQSSLWNKLALQPEGLNDVVVVPLAKMGGSFSTLIIMRSAAAGDFSRDDADKLSALTPYFRHSGTIAHQLSFEPLSRHWAISNFDPDAAGIILTDALGKIVHANVAAGRWLDGCSLMCLEDELAARDIKTDGILKAAIADAARVRSDLPGTKPTSIIAKGPGTQELAISVARIGENICLPFKTRSGARVAVFVRALDPSDTAIQRFVGRYPITIGESRLVALLAQGLTLEKAARALPLSPYLARERLAGILRRTGAYDEADLAARLMGKARAHFDPALNQNHQYSEFEVVAV
jgi:hypothetical protein